jgi:recombination protein RecA
MAKKSLGSLEDRLAEQRVKLAKSDKGAKLVDFNNIEPVEVIPTGMVSLDAALGVGGFPRGRIVELFGEEASGKSTIAMSTAAQCLAMGEPVLYLDFEHSFSEDYAESFGIDTRSLLFNLSQPETAEDGSKLAEEMIDSGLATLIVWDSLASTMTIEERDAPPDKKTVASLARCMAAESRRLLPKVDRAGSVMIFVNHIGDKIGVWTPHGATVKTTPGGKWLKFLASLRIETSRRPLVHDVVDLVSDKKRTNRLEYGSLHTAIVRKNKVAPPGKLASFIIREGYGLCEQDIIARIAVKIGLIQQSGSWYSLPNGEKVQGDEAVFDALVNDSVMYSELRSMVSKALTVHKEEVAEESSEEEEDIQE